MTTANATRFRRFKTTGMVEVTKEKICSEWADKLRPAETFATPQPEEFERWLERQVNLIQEQAVIAAAAWARRRGDDPADAVDEKLVAEIAHGIALALESKSRVLWELDKEIEQALQVSGSSEA